MKALILGEDVVDVSNEEFEVNPELLWVNCPDNVIAGWSYKNKQFLAPPALSDEQKKQRCKQKATAKIAAVDWSVLPDAGLVNQADFIAYRAALRALIINPVADPVWPTEPTPDWG